MLSPCVNICVLDGATGWCLGCGRTGEEIAAWTTCGEAQRKLVLDRLPTRMAKLGE